MTAYQWIRTYLVTPPYSAASFTGFYLMSFIARWFDRKGKVMHRILGFWSWILLNTAGIRIITRGLEKIPRDGVYVIVSNHLSLADTPLMAAYLPIPFRFIAKASLAKVPIIGGHLVKGGHIIVQREDVRSGLKSLADAAQKIQDERVSILIFPEGTRGFGGKLHEFKGGAALLAIRAGLPVLPLAVTGTYETMPKGAMLLRPGTITLTAGDPIPVAGLTPHDRDTLTARIQSAVTALLQPNA